MVCDEVVASQVRHRRDTSGTCISGNVGAPQTLVVRFIELLGPQVCLNCGVNVCVLGFGPKCQEKIHTRRGVMGASKHGRVRNGPWSSMACSCACEY